VIYYGRFSGDYKAAFVVAVDEMLAMDMAVEYRIHFVNVLTDAYYAQTGQKPDQWQLHRLADYILRDELSDPHPDKVSREDYPILSVGQIKLRNGREYSGGDVAHYSADRKHKLNGTRRKARGELNAW
jgi:hypothetical protein